MKEKDHIEGFAPEVAWVTKAGNSEMAEPCAIRPTSETVMYPYFAKWIRSHRDLPLKINQWCNVVRWEFKNPQPFLRTREFLWQEGHTAHATQAEADAEVLTILEFYRQTYEDLLAVPVTPGVKSEKEKFAGALYTTTVEAFVPGSGRAIQGGTSHCLGQNFSKMFDITFENENAVEGAKKSHVWQNSWGFSTRSIGVCIMVHGDDKGLVMPPRVALYQVVVIPCGITAKTSDEDRKFISGESQKLGDMLRMADLRVTTDTRSNYTPGWKYSHWEQKGVPVRIEVGPKDLEKKSVMAVRRDTGEKISLEIDTLAESLHKLMDTIHDDLFAKAKKETLAHKPIVESWEEFLTTLDAGNLCQMPWCEEVACEESIKKDSTRSMDIDDKAPSMGAKSLCIPLVQPADAKGKACVKCGKPAKSYTMFGRSY
ncbi:prolyl-tRNA synthetase [Sphaeroforma arctica JP610]|uniref:proline--tRNA ligase n=1 Tax=Sphaeroforma arctica JP610 TaxID=667725 RepID=A0A0L0G8E5_9EUKA|nr:prolyl-tRNA synthetase [Sphaeroforma arctica JP610]KNC85179.1 prolyl-tRNA synthetase [Sphaeroforma arctica JP610]|eukprot:XP_014159081.1 prolyl-tRNA synthetase [Sphaeroforma arctica JP610]